MYLRQNTVAFDADVSVGTGPVVDDLAEMFGVTRANHREFAAVLRANYTVLSRMVHQIPRDRTASQRFEDHLIGAMRGSEVLRRDLFRRGLLTLDVTLAHTGSQRGLEAQASAPDDETGVTL